MSLNKDVTNFELSLESKPEIIVREFVFYVISSCTFGSEKPPKYGRTITFSLLDIARAIVFGAKVLYKNSLMHLSTKSREKVFLYIILFNVLTSLWNLTVSEDNLKHPHNNN